MTVPNTTAEINDSKQLGSMTREQIQSEAMIVESLLDTAQVMFTCPDTSDMYSLIEMAFEHAKRLNRALDSVITPEVAA